MKKIISVFLTLALLFGPCGCASSRYSEAKKLMNSRDYAKAKEILLEISDYENSAELIRKCDYHIAKKLMEENEYSAAKEALLGISNYEDSAELIRKCDYHTAKKLMEENEYSAAKEILLEISDYKDSASLIPQCEKKAFYLDSLVGKWRSTLVCSNNDYSESGHYKMELREDFTFTLTGGSDVLLAGECYFRDDPESKVLYFDHPSIFGRLDDGSFLLAIGTDGANGIFFQRS